MAAMDVAVEEDRMRFFEEAIVQAKKDYENNNSDAQALTRWGGALLEMAHFHRGEEAFALIDEAVQKLEEALRIDPKKHNALWCLGNAYTSKGFLITGDSAKAQELFDKALDCFKKAEAEEPGNDIYRRAVEVTEKAPEIYEELQRQLAAEVDEPGPSMGPRFPDGQRKAKNPTNSESVADFWWNAAGWGMLLTLALAWVLYLQRNTPQK